MIDLTGSNNGFGNGQGNLGSYNGNYNGCVLSPPVCQCPPLRKKPHPRNMSAFLLTQSECLAATKIPVTSTVLETDWPTWARSMATTMVGAADAQTYEEKLSGRLPRELLGVAALIFELSLMRAGNLNFGSSNGQGEHARAELHTIP